MRLYNWLYLTFELAQSFFNLSMCTHFDFNWKDIRKVDIWKKILKCIFPWDRGNIIKRFSVQWNHCFYHKLYSSYTKNWPSKCCTHFALTLWLLMFQHDSVFCLYCSIQSAFFFFYILFMFRGQISILLMYINRIF